MTKSSLRRELVIPIAVLVIGVSAAIAWVSLKAGTDAVETLTQRVLLDVVNRINVAADKHLDGALIALESVAPNPLSVPEEQAFSTNVRTLEQKLWSASGLFMDVNYYVYFGGKDGQFVGVNRIAKDNVELYLRESDANVRKVYQVAKLDDRSKLLRTDQFDPRNRPWYQSSMNSERPVWSKIYSNYVTHVPTITLAKAVFKENHEFIGVIATDVTLNELSRFLRKLEVDQNSVAYIVDEDGYIVATSGVELPEKNDRDFPERMFAREMKTPMIGETARQLNNKDLSISQTQHLQTSVGAVEVVVSSLGRKQGLNWTTVVVVPRADFMSGINKGFMQSIAIAIACIIFALTIGLTIVERVIRDIRKLTAAVKRFGDGEPLTDLKIQRTDEIGILAATFSEMENKLRFDRLTQVANREYLFSQINYLQKQAKLKSRDFDGFTLLFIDLDRFKLVNDSYGHDAGDQVLVIIAARLRAAVRDTDEVARYGGDEFVLLLKETKSSIDINIMVEKIISLVEKPIALDNVIVSVGASIGWASFPEDGDDYVRLIKVADSRMYHKKRDRKSTQMHLV
ncbi:MAG: diguanylate cyclase [Pseudomonadota bacterium]